MLTCAPFLATSPACGDWLITRPLGTVALDASEATGSRPARRNAAPAACSLCPLTSGTLTDEPGCVSSTAATASAATRMAASPHSSARRRRPRSCCSGGPYASLIAAGATSSGAAVAGPADGWTWWT